MTPENPTGATVSGFGNVLTQAWIVHDIDQRWAVALGGQPSTLKRNCSENKSALSAAWGAACPVGEGSQARRWDCEALRTKQDGGAEGFEFMAIAFGVLKSSRFATEF